MKKVFIPLLLAGLWWCWKYHATHFKGKPLGTLKVADGIYEQRFLINEGGALNSNDYACYLTDSLNFRKFVGTYDGKELYHFKAISSDKVMAIKYSRRIYYGKETPVDTTLFSVAELRKEGRFD